MKIDDTLKDGLKFFGIFALSTPIIIVVSLAIVKFSMWIANLFHLIPT